LFQSMDIDFHNINEGNLPTIHYWGISIVPIVDVLLYTKIVVKWCEKIDIALFIAGDHNYKLFDERYEQCWTNLYQEMPLIWGE
jgi:hypothetical protein